MCTSVVLNLCRIHSSILASIARLAADDAACATGGALPPFLYIIDWSVPHQHAHLVDCSSNARTLPLAYGFLLLILALFKAREFWKLNGYRGSRLVLVLIKDQAFYYFMYVSSFYGWALFILLCRVIFCVVFGILDNRFAITSLFANAIFQGLGSPTLLCIFGSRMFFNLKEAAGHGVNIGTNWTSYSLSAIRFEDESFHSRFVESLHKLKIHLVTK